MRPPRGAAGASRIASRRTSMTHPRTRGESHRQNAATSVCANPLIDLLQRSQHLVVVGQFAEDRSATSSFRKKASRGFFFPLLLPLPPFCQTSCSSAALNVATRPNNVEGESLKMCAFERRNSVPWVWFCVFQKGTLKC